MSLLNPDVSASTLSVVQNPEDSITCYLELGEESCNLTLRLEGEKARLAGYPQTWRTWDENIVGEGETTYEDAEHDGSVDSFVDEIEAMDAYVSRETEKEIFAQLKKALQAQFEDVDFKDTLTPAQQESVLAKMDEAIKSLN